MTGELEEEAKSCDNCLCWHKHCRSECCRVMAFNFDDVNVVKELVAQGVPFKIPRRGRERTKDMGWYFKLHGLKVEREQLVVNPLLFEVSFEGSRALFRRDCNLLDEKGLCKGHPDGKPGFCKRLDVNDYVNEAYYLPPSCLANYKDKG